MAEDDDVDDEKEEEGSSSDSEAASDFSDDDQNPALPDTSPSKASTSDINTSLADSPSKSSVDDTPSANRTAEILLPPPLARLTSFNLYRHHHGPIPAPAPQTLNPVIRQPVQEEDRKSETQEQKSRSSTPSVAPSRSSQVSGSTRERERDPNAAVTRSQCKFHKIAIPVPASSDEEGEATEQEANNGGSSRAATAQASARGPRKVIFIVPYCSLSNQEKIEEENIEVQGEASRLENETKVAIPEFAEHVIGSYVLASLLALVGHHIMQDACAWLPSPDEELAYQRYLKKRREEAAATSASRSSLSRRRKSSTSTARPKSAGGKGSRPGPSRVSTARPKSKSSQKRKAEDEPAENGDVPKIEISGLLGDGSDSDSLTELSDSDSSQAPSQPSRQPTPTPTPAKRPRKSGRRIADPAYQPPAEEHSGSEGSAEDRPRKKRRRSTRNKPKDTAEGSTQPTSQDGTKSKKRSRPTAAPASVQEAEGTGPPKAAKRRRKNVDASVNGDSGPETEQEGEPSGLKPAKGPSLLLDSPARHT
ncbi:hypothetical protein FRC01_013283, partial [Tulasnella sp. 417]